MTDYQTFDTCFNKGVSAAYCGIVNEQLLIAGGCNFPHIPAAEGGEKVYYDYIWTAPLNQGTSPEWTLAGRLPQPAAYGITLPYNGGLICIGGMTSGGQTLRDVFFLNLKDDEIQVDPLPALPVAIDNAYGSMADQKVYVVGGNADGKPSNTVYTLDLTDEQASWVAETQWPGVPRVQPVCAIAGENLYVYGGYTPKTEDTPASMPVNGFKYNLKTQAWSELEAPTAPDGNVIALAGGAAVTAPDGKQINCIGGVNQDIFPRALNGELTGPAYMSHPAEWYRFNRYILAFQVETETWNIQDEREEGARAGACLVNDGTWNYIINGELKPGIRTPMISRFK
ncbi:MAG: cyclically-permuted mutarotase family protein [Bacteroidales bacterium]|nr:cyclically-permuted mutarotase family protein [Bacteroidales bacterium]